MLAAGDTALVSRGRYGSKPAQEEPFLVQSPTVTRDQTIASRVPCLSSSRTSRASRPISNRIACPPRMYRPRLPRDGQAGSRVQSGALLNSIACPISNSIAQYVLPAKPLISRGRHGGGGGAPPLPSSAAQARPAPGSAPTLGSKVRLGKFRVDPERRGKMTRKNLSRHGEAARSHTPPFRVETRTGAIYTA